VAAGVEEVVLTVRVEVPGSVPVMVVEGALQVIPVGLPATEHEKLTAPVNPPEGVTVSVEVLLDPEATVMLPLLVREKLLLEFEEPLTMACSPSVWMNLPAASDPVTNTLYVPFPVAAGAFTVKTVMAIPPLERELEGGFRVHVTPVAVEQV
jgi:hypothetical protein